MPRNGSNIWSPPAGTTATPNTPIESAKYNAFVADLTNDLNLARPIVAGGTGATTKSGAQQALDLEPGVDIQAYNAKLAALAALTLAADKLIYATGTDTLATSDLTPFARTLLAAPDLAAIWTLLYLGALAGKNKISVPGDINASGTPADWSVLFGDGVWRSIFGLGVQWLDLTASRAKDTVYQNANGRAIAVTVTSSGGFIDRQLQVSADNTTWRTISDFNFSGTSTVTGVVPSGHYYRFVSTGTMFRWMELRS